MIRLRPAVVEDIAFITATEQRPGYERFIGQWPAERHRETMQSAASQYLIGDDPEGAPAGFAIVLERDNKHGNVLLQRLAVTHPGQGVGRAVLAAVTGWVFAQPQAHRLWFNMFADNHRAHRTYLASGFTVEGRLREARLRPDGSRCDSLIFSMLRTEWPFAPGSATT
jgi:RimJ/RimL family protein N-acetyltransferase